MTQTTRTWPCMIARLCKDSHWKCYLKSTPWEWRIQTVWTYGHACIPQRTSCPFDLQLEFEPMISYHLSAIDVWRNLNVCVSVLTFGIYVYTYLSSYDQLASIDARIWTHNREFLSLLYMTDVCRQLIIKVHLICYMWYGISHQP